MRKFFAFFLVFIPMFAFSQTALTIDKALSESTTYLKSRLPAKAKVAVLNFSSDWPQLSSYIIEELMTYLVNEGTLTVVDRQNLETIRKEMDFQLSGEVSDETAQSIGKKLGAQTIISGGIQPVGATYRLRIRAISVETAQVQGMQSVDVVHDSRLAALTGTASAGAAASNPSRSYIPLTGTQWRSDKFSNDATVKSKTTIQYTVKRESIEGQDRDVLTVEANLAKGGNYSSAQIQLVQDDDKVISQQMEQGTGIRFKALGDGKKWRIYVPTTEITKTDFAFYQTVITTKKGKVVEIDIPYAKLNQPKWGKPVAFNKNSIISLSIELNSDENKSRGASTIKIFDFEIY